MTVTPTQAVPPSPGGNSSSLKEDAVDDDQDQEATRRDVVVEKECSGGYLGTAVGAVNVGIAATAISKGHSPQLDHQQLSAVGTPLPPTVCTPVSIATSPVASFLPGSSCDQLTITDGSRPTVFPTAVEGGSDGARTGKGGRDGSIATRRRLPEQGPLTSECLSGVNLVCGDIFQEQW